MGRDTKIEWANHTFNPWILSDMLSPYGISWVIAGAESGPHARPMDLGWVRSLRDQCADARVPFFFKQGEHKTSTPMLDGKKWLEVPR